MEASQGSPNFYDLARVDGKGNKIGRASASEPLFIDLPSARHGTERLNTQEDWLPLATADPAFWFKETTVSEEASAERCPTSREW